MRQEAIVRPNEVAETAAKTNKRRTERVPAQFSLMYSGMHDGHMLIGNGIVTNLSDSGIGIRGNHLVELGMALSLFIDLPGVEEPVCIAQSHVSWISGRRFGVEMIAPKLETQNQLRFYVWNHLFRLSRKRS
ncbi:PilZ domain-containing protein [Petrachloros mirabilis]